MLTMAALLKPGGSLSHRARQVSHSGSRRRNVMTHSNYSMCSQLLWHQYFILSVMLLNSKVNEYFTSGLFKVKKKNEEMLPQNH